MKKALPTTIVKKQKKEKVPDFTLEAFARSKGFSIIAGVDEAGRGPWAGPVVAGAVVLNFKTLESLSHLEVNDSKKLSASKRQKIFELLPSYASIGTGIAHVTEIDNLNILKASFLAMARAISGLPTQPDYIFVDGNKLPNLPCPGEAVVKGDSRSISIAAASIVAKVSRDKIMTNLAQDYPGYGWERNSGYGTPEHKKALDQFGVTEHHRLTYAPIIKMLGKTKR